ncbi:Protein CREG1 [Hondaea fermentalgiana]|uniref:Protein CREG1 n=1 Tax=Hondaea fermentalgiana TaxID=2315210 RepID=A0A2R5GSJ0_9STRA|nr:Protein CREG1 [Hondaea fermentalgiana]|eukprot:GBG33846.1 Protein CREG1 [Hondaea fermentalgiana]
MKMGGSALALLVGILAVVAPCAEASPQPPSQPSRKDYAAAARWLLCASDHGIMATDGGVVNADLRKDSSTSASIPFGNVVAFADGNVEHNRIVNCTGEPYFYLTKLDATQQDLEGNSWATLAMSMADLRYSSHAPCSLVNAESPLCWRLNLVGKVSHVGENEKERARHSLFSRHPDMKFWPSDHEFQIFKMQVSKVFLIDFFGGAPNIPIEDYMNVVLDDKSATTLAPQ